MRPDLQACDVRWALSARVHVQSLSCCRSSIGARTLVLAEWFGTLVSFHFKNVIRCADVHNVVVIFLMIACNATYLFNDIGGRPKPD